MKKATLLAMAAALFMGATAVAQETQEVTYVSDPSQGYLFNRFKDNWFITGEGGVGIYFSHGDSSRKLMDRWSPAASIYIGKWFSPLIGVRLGANFLQCKGLSDVITGDTRVDEPTYDGKYKQKFAEIGPVADVMLNLTNWWCGYRPGRVYNAILYGGAGGYWTYSRDYSLGTRGPWKNNLDRVLTVRAGLINSFRITEQVALALDLRWSGIDNHKDEAGDAWNRTSHDFQAYLGVTYLFKKREWDAPVIPVCPEVENCDAVRARLEAAEGRIADLEDQLRNALNRPTEVVAVEETFTPPLATIYYPINVYTLSSREVSVLDAVSNIMKSNPNTHYVLTGWADNYTGNEQINVRLRHNRVNGVEKQLIKFGVPKSQLTTTINNGNLCDLGEKYVALDRAVTIQEAQ